MKCIGCALLLTWLATPPADAYIQVAPPTLRQLCEHSHYILLMRVEKVHAEKNIVLFRKVRDLKGKYPTDVVKLSNGGHETRIPDCCERLDQSTLLPGERRALLRAAEVGKPAVFFVCRYDTVSCSLSHSHIDDQWYGHCSAAGEQNRWEWYYLLLFESHLRKVFFGSTDRLTDAVTEVLAGKDPAITCLLHPQEVDIHLQPLELRLSRSKVQRLRASGQPARDGRDAKEALALAQKLSAAELGVRLKAATELGELLGPELKEAVPALVRALQDKEVGVRRAAVAALRRAENDPALIPPLVEAMKDKDGDVCRKAGEALTALGPAARNAQPALLELLKHPEWHVVAASVEVLSIIDPEIEAKVPAVSQALETTASVAGNYKRLLGKFKCPKDLNRVSYFQDLGRRDSVSDYQGHRNVPKGYWVYAYPYWFIWGEQASGR